MVPRFLSAALKGESITIYGDGSQTRTFCYVDDNIDTIIGCLERNLFVNDVLNIGSDVEYSILDLAKKIITSVDSKSCLEHLPSLKEGDMTRRKPDISKMMSVLKRELVTIDQGINLLSEFYARSSGK